MRFFIIIILLVAVIFVKGHIDKPCASYKDVDYESVVCVCNRTYCDTVTREPPINGQYVAYTTSKAGLRFKKSYGKLEDYQDKSTGFNKNDMVSFELELKTMHQTIIGFGGATTDAAGINWKRMTKELQTHMVNSYFSSSGLQYSMLRLPIGGSDFSTHPYAYNELPTNDIKLSNFSLSPEDYKYKIPLIKAALQESDSGINIVATTWSPPPWMKTNNGWNGYSRLKEEYMQTYADYHLKFIESYVDNGIPIWGITTTNEPVNGVLSLANFNSLGWTMNQMAQYITKNLGPTLRNSTYKDVKILVNDDQRIMIPYFFNAMVLEYPETLNYVNGVAVHYYIDALSPPVLLSEVSRLYPDIFVLGTEACAGSLPWEKRGVLLGSWSRAAHYISDIITDLNYDVVGWIDWNLILDTQGGPNWVSNFVDATIIMMTEERFVKQPTFYALGHFSKFIPRDSRRIEVKEMENKSGHSVENVAFITPRNTIVIVLFNRKEATTVKVKIDNKQIVKHLDENSVTTMEFIPPEV